MAAHRAQLAPKGLPGKRHKGEAPNTRTTTLQDAPVGLPFLGLFPQRSHLQIRTMAASWSASWGWGGVGRQALPSPSVELQD